MLQQHHLTHLRQLLSDSSPLPPVFVKHDFPYLVRLLRLSRESHSTTTKLLPLENKFAKLLRRVHHRIRMEKGRQQQHEHPPERRTQNRRKSRHDVQSERGGTGGGYSDDEDDDADVEEVPLPKTFERRKRNQNQKRLGHRQRQRGLGNISVQVRPVRETKSSPLRKTLTVESSVPMIPITHKNQRRWLSDLLAYLQLHPLASNFKLILKELFSSPPNSNSSKSDDVDGRTGTGGGPTVEQDDLGLVTFLPREREGSSWSTYSRRRSQRRRTTMSVSGRRTTRLMRGGESDDSDDWSRLVHVRQFRCEENLITPEDVLQFVYCSEVCIPYVKSLWREGQKQQQQRMTRSPFDEPEGAHFPIRRASLSRRNATLDRRRTFSRREVLRRRTGDLFDQFEADDSENARSRKKRKPDLTLTFECQMFLQKDQRVRWHSQMEMMLMYSINGMSGWRVLWKTDELKPTRIVLDRNSWVLFRNSVDPHRQFDSRILFEFINALMTSLRPKRTCLYGCDQKMEEVIEKLADHRRTHVDSFFERC